MAVPRIVGGSSYNNPYAQPVGSDVSGASVFDSFAPSSQELQDIKDDPITEIKAEFAEAQRRQRDPKPRKGVQI